MNEENKTFLEKYLSEAKESTSIGEHLFATNILLNEIAKNTATEEVCEFSEESQEVEKGIF